MYEGMIKELRITSEFKGIDFFEDSENIRSILTEAADTIEEEDMAFRHLERDYKELCAHLPKWIPVTERLPEEGEIVLGYTPCDGYMFVGKCYTYKFGNETDVNWQIITAMRSTRTMKKKVTHWMPLPEPPKEET